MQQVATATRLWRAALGGQQMLDGIHAVVSTASNDARTRRNEHDEYTLWDQFLDNFSAQASDNRAAVTRLCNLSSVNSN